MITMKNLQINQILALNNLLEVYMPLKSKLHQTKFI